MAATKPSKKQRGKKNAAAKAKKASAKLQPAGVGASATNKHVKFNDDGEKVSKGVALQKKRARAAAAAANADEKKEGGGKSDRSPEMIQQAKYYLTQWTKRNEPTPEGELPWKFKVCG